MLIFLIKIFIYCFLIALLTSNRKRRKNMHYKKAKVYRINKKLKYHIIYRLIKNMDILKNYSFISFKTLKESGIDKINVHTSDTACVICTPKSPKQ